jgi:RNA polymerase sigma factor (TIGR02999 family)
MTNHDPSADQLAAQLYGELRALAHSQLRRERTGHTLGTTALVHEAYLRLGHGPAFGTDDRTRFFGAASTAMRRVLVDHARHRLRLKRGAGADAVQLDDVAELADSALLTDTEADELLTLDDALDRLAQVNPRGSAVVQHRFFAGLSLEETAEVLGVSAKTVQRDWMVARAWLRKEIAGETSLFAMHE